jgi:amino acid adenylation domain-containing protein
MGTKQQYAWPLQAALSERVKATYGQGIGDLATTLLGALQIVLYRYGHPCNLLIRRRVGASSTPPACCPVPRGPLEPKATIGDVIRSACVRAQDLAVDPSLPTIAVSDDGAPDSLLREADLAFHLPADPAGPIAVVHDVGVYGPETVAQMCAHLELVLAASVESTNTSLDALSILSDQERQNLLNDWNGKAIDYPTNALLHDQVSVWARETPDAVALEFRGDLLRYRDLESVSSRFANQLRALQVGPDTPVAVHAERSLELFVAILAIFKCGGSLLYLDPSEPPARLRDLCGITRTQLVLSDRSAGRSMVLDGRKSIEIDRLLSEPPDFPDVAPTIDADGELTAYILFTSGSTGTPKGVRRSHRMCSSRMRWEQALYGLTPDERHLLKSPISFREFIWPLSTGGVAIIAEPGRERDDRYLVDLISHRGVTVVSFVPSMLQVLVDSPNIRCCQSLKHVFSGGEPLSPLLERGLRDLLGVEVHNTYTLTEADYVCTRRGESGHKGIASIIGRPTDMAVYLCDPDGQLVPIGIPGEMYVGGPGLASGYVGRPDLTAERFLPNPFGERNGSLLFRTGDLARFLGDGQLEYLGRIDHQVKVRGLRVDPREVEYALRQHPAVGDAAVVGRPDPDQGSRLIGYVIPVGSQPAPESLRAHLEARLPAHMVPSVFAFLDQFPKLLSGKLNRAALPEPPSGRPSLDVPYAAPRSELEKRVCGVWEAVLDVQGIGVDDAFKALGGDSLRILAVRKRLEEELCQRLDLGLLLQYSTVAQLSAALERGTVLSQEIERDAEERRRKSLAQRRRRAFERGRP